MGGRGATSGFVNRIPNAGKAVIADSKITKYLLEPAQKHYQEFVSVGYSENDPEKLKSDLLEGLANNTAKVYETNAHGDTAYEVDMLLGVNRKAKFRTAWQIDRGSSSPRFITAHRIGGNRK